MNTPYPKLPFTEFKKDKVNVEEENVEEWQQKFYRLKVHRIIEWLGLEGTLNPPNLSLNTSNDGTFTPLRQPVLVSYHFHRK